MTRTSDRSREIYELRITLRGTKPPIWRRVAVEADVTLAELHEIVQIAMGWLDGHLHQFRMKIKVVPPRPAEIARIAQSGGWEGLEARLRDERIFCDLCFDGMDGEDERQVRLSELCPKVKDKLLYDYDFGDGWEHSVEVTKMRPPKDGVRYPTCLAGKRACPPEDCGGVWGYYDMLAALADPKHLEHEHYSEWLGGDFDSDLFDPNEANDVFAEWKRHIRLKIVSNSECKE